VIKDFKKHRHDGFDLDALFDGLDSLNKRNTQLPDHLTSNLGVKFFTRGGHLKLDAASQHPVLVCLTQHPGASLTEQASGCW
jgi:hypothetical protein